MPGKEVCRAFKAHAASVPVIVLSANNEVEDKVLLLELGADDYVNQAVQPEGTTSASATRDAPERSAGGDM